MYSAMRGDERNRKTFILILAACAHRGDVAEAQRIWREDICDENVRGDAFVVATLVDGMARKGMLSEALDLVLRQSEADGDVDADADASVMWMSLLHGCIKHREKEIGHRVFEEIQRRFPHNEALLTSATVLNSKLYDLYEVE